MEGHLIRSMAYGALLFYGSRKLRYLGGSGGREFGLSWLRELPWQDMHCFEGHFFLQVWLSCYIIDAAV